MTTNKHKLLIKTPATTLVAATATLFATTRAAYADFADDAQTGVDYVDNGSTAVTADNLFQTIVNTLLFLVGAVSVVVLIIAGIRFIVSSGDAQAAASAKNTILYAVIGVIVAVTAYGVLNYVLDKLY